MWTDILIRLHLFLHIRKTILTDFGRIIGVTKITFITILETKSEADWGYIFDDTTLAQPKYVYIEGNYRQRLEFPKFGEARKANAESNLSLHLNLVSGAKLRKSDQETG